MNNNCQKSTQQEEIFDEELQAMGIPFEDETEPKEMPRMEPDASADAAKAKCKQVCQEGQGQAKNTNWYPMEKRNTSLQDRLVGCVKWMGICGGISMLLWWFQINDLMAMQAAYPCIVACGILGGFGVGKNAVK